MYSFGDYIDLETRAKEKGPNIGRYKKISKNEVKDTVTNKIITCRSRDVKEEKALFKNFKGISRLILANFFGTDAEMLTKFGYDNGPIDTYRDFEYCFRKLQRRAKQKLLYIVVLQYQSNGLPRLECWLKTADNSKINLTQELVEECWKCGTVETVKLTPTNIVGLAQYFIPKNHSRLDSFPINAKLYRTSRKGIRKVTVEILDYEEAEKRVTGMERTFASTKKLVDKVNGKEILYQQTSYESYSKPKEETETPNSNDTL